MENYASSNILDKTMKGRSTYGRIEFAGGSRMAVKVTRVLKDLQFPTIPKHASCWKRRKIIPTAKGPRLRGEGPLNAV